MQCICGFGERLAADDFAMRLIKQHFPVFYIKILLSFVRYVYILNDPYALHSCGLCEYFDHKTLKTIV